ncbi:heterokaryon incompatibility protein-domain-containing protein [Hypomontagnella monticulosa]|nr:heterokaryon incompatibility protein-domain-containing protein [Hypomontagnella monticulosa]
MVPYVYTPLPDNHIRLLTLFPSLPTDDIVITLQLSRLRQDAYEALSYVWGSQENPRSAYSDENRLSTISVTQNLDEALRHLRYTDRPRIMWIDTICINQFDHVEKGKQVAMMGNIYRDADRVVVWLGPEQDESGLTWSMTVLEGAVNATWVDDGAMLPFDIKDIVAIYNLLSRQWFTRLWIRREIYLARDTASVKCGKQDIPWSDLGNAMVALFRTRHPINDREDDWEALRKSLRGFVSQNRKLGLRDLQSDFELALCEDPRDRLYEVLHEKLRLLTS